MDVNLSSSLTQVNDKFRPAAARDLRPVSEAEDAGGKEAPAEVEALETRAVARNETEEQPRKSAVNSDTGRNIDISV